MQPTRRRALVAVGFAALAGCTAHIDRASPPVAHVVQSADSALNPIVVKVTAVVPESDVRHVTEEIRIAPGATDISTFTNIHEFVVDKAGSYWVYDDPANTIFMFDSAGKFIRKLGRDGKGPGEFRFNGGMVALADGRVAEWDDGNSRVSFFSPAGQFQTSWLFPMGSVRMRALVVDASGALYVKRTVFEREALLRVRDGGGDTLFAPNLQIPDRQYELHMMRTSDSSEMLLMATARYAPKMLWDWHPNGFFVTGHGALYQITLFRTKERPIRIERAFTPVPVAPDERKAEEQSILGGSSRPWKGPPLPEMKPALMDLFVARDGRIWARVPAASDRVITSNPDRRPGKPATITTYRTPVIWEVFSPEGAFLGRVAFPGRAKLMQADGNRVWAIQLDDDDLPSSVRYRIEPPLPPL